MIKILTFYGACLYSFTIYNKGTFLWCFTDLELVSQRYEMLAGMVFMLFWGFGALLLTGIAYFIRDWRYLNFYLAIPTVLFISYFKYYKCIFNTKLK